jgi:hypothetical protein
MFWKFFFLYRNIFKRFYQNVTSISIHFLFIFIKTFYFFFIGMFVIILIFWFFFIKALKNISNYFFFPNFFVGWNVSIFFTFVGLRIWLNWISKVISSKFFFFAFFLSKHFTNISISFFCRFTGFWTLLGRNFEGNLRNVYCYFLKKWY